MGCLLASNCTPERSDDDDGDDEDDVGENNRRRVRKKIRSFSPFGFSYVFECAIYICAMRVCMLVRPKVQGRCGSRRAKDDESENDAANVGPASTSKIV